MKGVLNKTAQRFLQRSKHQHSNSSGHNSGGTGSSNSSASNGATSKNGTSGSSAGGRKAGAEAGSGPGHVSGQGISTSANGSGKPSKGPPGLTLKDPPAGGAVDAPGAVQHTFSPSLDDDETPRSSSDKASRIPVPGVITNAAKPQPIPIMAPSSRCEPEKSTHAITRKVHQRGFGVSRLMGGREESVIHPKVDRTLDIARDTHFMCRILLSATLEPYSKPLFLCTILCSCDCVEPVPQRILCLAPDSVGAVGICAMIGGVTSKEVRLRFKRRKSGRHNAQSHWPDADWPDAELIKPISCQRGRKHGL